MGLERSSDLSRSLPAYFRYKLIIGNGKFNIVQALKNMPEYIGFSKTSTNLFFEIMTSARDWND